MNDRELILHYGQCALEAGPRQPSIYHALGQVLAEKGDLSGAVQALSKAAELAPNNSDFYYSLGLTLRMKGDLDGAEKALREAVRLSPTHVLARRALGILLRQKGDLQGALTELRAAAAERPDDAETRQALLTEVMPRVEKDYRVLTGRANTAITSISMGGGQALQVGLNNLDRFAWVGGFSSAVFGDPARVFPHLDAQANSDLRLLFISCGEQDMLADANHQLRVWLRSKGVRFTEFGLPGMHNFLVFRRSLAAFVPLLFQESAP